ncbi:hypothetical protein MRB53_010349 [Persea americana]|uniref:Uncharacterized protein n=1 Tax=Persea americana TaxID=3435 RepID=A0ACC2LRP6_PERAE|nr:hypothetical protein MRB53_010349 [Persea americana]
MRTNQEQACVAGEEESKRIRTLFEAWLAIANRGSVAELSRRTCRSPEFSVGSDRRCYASRRHRPIVATTACAITGAEEDK